MSVESSNQLGGWDCASDALAEIESYPNELQKFVADLFDQLGGLTDAMLVEELARQRAEQKSERDAMREQIDRLAAVTAELAKTVTEPNMVEQAK